VTVLEKATGLVGGDGFEEDVVADRVGLEDDVAVVVGIDLLGLGDADAGVVS